VTEPPAAISGIVHVSTPLVSAPPWLAEPDTYWRPSGRSSVTTVSYAVPLRISPVASVSGTDTSIE
jgi:hypothetical protein